MATASAPEAAMGSQPRRKNARRRRHALKRQRHDEEASDAEDARLRLEPAELADMPHVTPETTMADLALVKAELGYVPGHLRRIAARDSEGRPAVLQLYPLGVSRSYKRRKRQRSTGDVAEPFPTMLWLVSKAIGLQVARLEYRGGVATMEKRLQESDPAVRAAQRAAHEHYAGLRWAMINETDLAICEARGWIERLRDSGVAGMANFESVKCLHAHYAHHLAIRDGALFTDADASAGVWNHVGAWVEEELKVDAARAEEGDGKGESKRKRKSTSKALATSSDLREEEGLAAGTPQGENQGPLAARSEATSAFAERGSTADPGAADSPAGV